MNLNSAWIHGWVQTDVWGKKAVTKGVNDSPAGNERRGKCAWRGHYMRVMQAYRPALLFLTLLMFTGCSQEQLSPGGDVSPAPTHPVGRFAENTFVDGTDIGGMEYDEAYELLKPNADKKSEELRLTLRRTEGDAGAFVLTGMDIETENGLDAALNRALSNGGGAYEISPNFNENALDAWISELAAMLYVEPVPDGLTVITNHDEAVQKGRFLPSPGHDGSELDTGSLKAAIQSGQSDIVLPMRTIPLQDVDGKDTPGDSPSVSGAPIIPSPDSTNAPDNTESPDVVLPELLGAFCTQFSIWSESAENRAFNIEKAAAMINGSCVKAGASFSCNNVLGERSAENGWKPATAFVNGGRDTEEQYGGGICQISSTMYNAVLRSDLHIVERSGHSRMVQYVPGGADAVISGDTLDFVWQNNTNSDIYVFMWIANQTELHCEIYGERMSDEFDAIDVESVLTETIAPSAPEFTSDPNLPYGACELTEEASEGKVFETYKVYYKNEREVRRELVDKTEYRMRPAIYSVGSGE